jgi:hypothetical protein
MNHMLRLLSVACIAAPLWAATASSVATFSKDIAPLFYKNCAGCHRPGETAPMSLLTYKDARPWAAAIAEKVLDRSMPPWLADPHVGKFENARALSSEEIRTISTWARNGAPEGDARDLPPLPKFPEGWHIGKPDVVISMKEDYAVPASGTIPYQNFRVETTLEEDKWIKAAEIQPGNRAIVHHVIVYMREPGGPAPQAGKSAASDGRDPLLVGFAPGEQPAIYSPDEAKLLKKGTTLIFQMHYTPNGKAATDRTSVGLVFAKEPPARKVVTWRALNSSFVLPPGDGNHEVASSWTAPEDVHVNLFMPHMHLRGKDFKYTVVYPDGRSEVVLNVPRYDFNWQLAYRLAEPLALPKGSKIECVAHFDNSANNKFNPDPSKEVKWGPQTWEEMMIGWFDYTTDRGL